MTDFFLPFAEKMRRASQPEIAIRTFEHYYRMLTSGETGMYAESDVQPVDTLPDSEQLTGVSDAGREALAKAVVIKLNGGLGTSMGMTRAKSLLTIKDGHSFLDIIAKQALHLRDQHSCRLPFVLMNSFSTRDDSLAALAGYDDLATDLPLDFVQHKVPKVRADDLTPVQWPTNAAQEWCPPGHGDLYTALITSGMLDRLLDGGFEYVFVSNSDNLGAVLDLDILGYFAQNDLPFLMEVWDRTEADRKGGHLARRVCDGRLILRESAQCPPEDIETFQDHHRHRFFNTNNLWFNLKALKKALDDNDGILGLPMIRNKKTVDPSDSASPAVYQLETAMGAAIGVFEGAGAIRVPRGRFVPVKTTADLLRVWSDVYVLSDDHTIVQSPERSGDTVLINLNAKNYKLVDQLRAHFPDGVPSLIGCDKLTVKGDVQFGADVTVTGTVEVGREGESMAVEAGSNLHG